MKVDGVSYDAMLENPRNEYKLYTLTDSRIVPVLRYVQLDETGHIIGNPGKDFYRPIEYEIALGETGNLEIIGPLRLFDAHIMVQRYVTLDGMIKILKNLSQTTTVVVGTLP